MCMSVVLSTSVTVCIVVLFFFSSRRRHTRYWRDWSSDVCSSDLLPGYERSERRRGLRAGPLRDEPCLGGSCRCRLRDLPERIGRVRLPLPPPWQIGRASCRERV